MPGEIVFSSSTVGALVTGEFLVDVAQMIPPAVLPNKLVAFQAKHKSVDVRM